MFELIGFERTTQISFKKSSKQRNNYLPKVKNYFTLYFNRYAQKDTFTNQVELLPFIKNFKRTFV